ncbi:MAG: protein translocase subunit SecF [Candidatus Falkowbacteria bacterium]
MFKIIQKRKIWISISLALMTLSVVAIAAWGLKFGIDFTGGSLLEVSFASGQPSVVEVQDAVKNLGLNSLSVQPTTNSFILRFQETSEDAHQKVVTGLKTLATSKSSTLEELTFTSIGPSIGQEMQRKALTSIILVLLAISLYISYAFRKVSRPVSSWDYGFVTLFALFHDALITVGFMAVLGKFFGVDVNISSITAVLTVIGFSVHDTIVVFDRIRENLPKSTQDFEGTVNVSVNQTLTRSINTSMTVMLVLACIVIFGGPSIKYFALTLLVGIFFGTYSSIFLASPLMVVWEKFNNRRNK